LGDIPLRYPPYNNFKHTAFKAMGDLLLPLAIPAYPLTALRDVVIITLAAFGAYFTWREGLLPLLLELSKG